MRDKEYDKSLFEYRDWHVVREIGAGSFGKVYEIQKEDFGYTYKSALKIISIPQPDQDLTAIKENIGKSDESLELYYESVASEIVKEFELMYKLRGFSNIVSYEDHEVRKHEDGIGWDIMIRMELLTPLDVYKKNHPLKRKDIIRLGIDICNALERCEKYGIVHRDIKPGNIFVSEQGDFKLGDFGIARTIEAYDSMLELSQKGTINYMAPEILKGETYSFNVDLYSLGIVMYRFLNQDTLPFLPLPPKEVKYSDVEVAKQSRFGGKEIPRPCDDNTQLSDIVLKACKYNPNDRYRSPSEMRYHLEMVEKNEFINVFDKNIECSYSQDETIEGLTVNIGLENIRDDKTDIAPPISKISKKIVNEIEAEEVLRTKDNSIINEDSQMALRKNTRKIPLKSSKIIIGTIVVTICASVIFWVIASQSDKNKKIQETVRQEIKKEEESEPSDLVKLIEQHNFVSSYKMIQDSTKNGENVDEEIKLFVKECQSEQEFKRAVAVMNLLSDNISANEIFYRETVQWFYEHNKADLVRQILADLRKHGTEGENLADIISSEYIDINYNEGEEKNEG